ncbi:hypothetical protein AB7M16_003317 [Bradyrhizobium sp. USDA 372]
MGLTRKRVKQTTSLEHRLAQFAEHMRRRADAKLTGAEKNELHKKVGNAEQALDIERQLRQPH